MTSSAACLARHLSDKLDFLCGVLPSDLLADAGEDAQALGVFPDRLLIAEGLIDPEDMMDALAAQLGVPRASGEEQLDPDEDWRNALLAGVARLQGGGFLIAPEGAAIEELLRKMSSFRPSPPRITLASRCAFERLLVDRFGDEMAHAASHDLPTRRPELSAKAGASGAQRRIAGGLLALAILGAWGHAIAWISICGLLSTAMMIAITAKLFAVAVSFAKRNAPLRLETARLPSYTVLAPLYREANVARDLVRALAALDYPAAKLEIIFLVESNDPETAAALHASALPPYARICVTPPGAPRTKPRALNFGLLLARGDLVVVYDAEDRPEADQLRKAADAFAALPRKVACLQASLAIHNARDSWLTRLFALDYAGQFDVVMQGFGALALPSPLGGTSNHFRADALRDVGGWDAWNVTEDADLGLRLARCGYRTAMVDSVTWEEAPPHWRDWHLQRRRWIKGWIQTLFTHLRQPGRLMQDLTPGAAAHVVCLLIANALSPLIGVWFTGYFVFQLASGRAFMENATLLTRIADLSFLTLACFGLAAVMVPTLAGASRRKLWTSLPWLALRPLHWLLLSLAAIDAIIDLIRAPFHWSKTRHGLARKADGATRPNIDRPDVAQP